jgi:hypothetical protein
MKNLQSVRWRVRACAVVRVLQRERTSGVKMRLWWKMNVSIT